MHLNAPELLTDAHRVAGFDSGEPSLDEWLERRALPNRISGASRTYVAADSAGKVAGYYALASGAIVAKFASGRFKRNMPDPIPVVILARLAVDRIYQGRGVGRALFRDAAERVVGAAGIIGVRGIVVHAISDSAKRFYQSLGFEASVHEPMTLLVTLHDVAAALRAGEDTPC